MDGANLRLSAKDMPMSQIPQVTKLLYSRKDAAFALSVSVRSLDYLIANKKLSTRKLGKKITIPHCELVKFARADHANLTQHLDDTDAK
jgi:hypothetical protein